MAALGLTEALELRDVLLGELVRPAAPPPAGAVRFQTLEVQRQEIVPVAVGISRRSEEAGYAMAIRVHGGSDQARREGERLRLMVEARKMPVDLAVTQDAILPGPAELRNSQGHPRLTKASQDLCLGLSIGHADGGIGTLGCFVDVAGSPALASCSHVLADSGLIAREAVWIHHPGRPDVAALGGATRIARLGEKFVEFSYNDDNRIDAALAPLYRPDRAHGNRVPPGLGSPFDGKMLGAVLPAAEAPARLGARVGKIGRTSGYTEGTLSAVLEQVRVVNPRLGTVIRFVDVLEVVWDDDDHPFTLAGDSGAIVFLRDDLRPFGMHFASPGQRSYACSLEAVLTQFDATWLP